MVFGKIAKCTLDRRNGRVRARFEQFVVVNEVWVDSHRKVNKISDRFIASPIHSMRLRRDWRNLGHGSDNE